MPSFPEGAEDILEASGVEKVARAITGAPQVAIDVEADSMHAFHARLCFVQLGTDDSVYLIDTLSQGVTLAPLAACFADPLREKVFHAAGGDLQFLAEAGVRVKGLFDTHRAATLLGWPKVGLADLARELVGIELAKEHQQADFAIRPLPEGMRDYIANDVRYLCEIGRRVRKACEEKDILEEVLLDCDRLADEATVRKDLADYEPKLPKGQGPKEALVAHHLARALHLKRLAWAEAADVPMGRMLSNAAVTAIAVGRPANLKQLQRLEGVRGAFVREHGEEVLAMVADLTAKAERGELAPPPSRGRPDPSRKKREEALKAFRAEKAAERKVTPSVVLPNPLVDALAVSPPEGKDGLLALPYFGEKRVHLYGEAILSLLQTH